MKYFVVRDPSRFGATSRYHVLEGKTVIAIHASRPEGNEVPMPAGVRWKLKPWNGSPSDIKVKRVTFHNVSAEVADAASQRAGEAYKKRIKWNGGKR